MKVYWHDRLLSPQLKCDNYMEIQKYEDKIRQNEEYRAERCLCFMIIAMGEILYIRLNEYTKNH